MLLHCVSRVGSKWCLFHRNPQILSKVVNIRQLTMEICSPVLCILPHRGSIQNHWCVHFNGESGPNTKLKLNLLAIITFNQVNFILNFRSCSRQPIEYHVPLIFNSCKNYLLFTFYWDSMYVFHTTPFWLFYVPLKS